jgi:methylated-DNA-[protein]-cysteine S-methyltransferase
LLKVPYGHTTSYSAIANAIGQPAAVRAVGMANRNNPIAIIVPCHRVIAKTGHLQGYFYGLDVKRQLLELENPMSFARQETLF